MLVELAIGDAYGAGFEYVRDRRFFTEHNDLSSYMQHPRHKQKPGAYTDDTQMSIAVAELVVEGNEWTPERIASKFVDVFHRDKREGYAGGFFQFLKKTHDGAAFLAGIHPDSDKSGAAMRAAPIGVYASISEVIEKCTVQAKLTHNTYEGINAAVSVSLMAHYFLYQVGPKAELPAFLTRYVPGQWTEPWTGEVRSKGYMSVRAALTSLLRNDTLSGLLKSCVAWTGDVDTVAAIALAAGSCSREVARDLPEVLVNGLEDGHYGRGFLGVLDKELMAVHAKQQRPRRRD